MTELTEAAQEVVRRAYEAASRFNPQAKIRIWLGDGQLETGFVEEPEPDDTIIEIDGLTLYVASTISDAVIDVSDAHERLILKDQS